MKINTTQNQKNMYCLMFLIISVRPSISNTIDLKFGFEFWSEHY